MSKTVQQQARQITRLEEKLECLENAPFIWRIPNFASVMEAARKEEQVVVTGGPFYSARNGYKFEMELYPNGYYTGDSEGARGEFMSIYIRVLVGEYDGVLRWPFRASVVFTLLDQSDYPKIRTNLIKKIVSAPQGLSRPTDCMQEACGIWQFVLHKELYSHSYIKDDVIYIKVSFGSDWKRQMPYPL